MISCSGYALLCHKRDMTNCRSCSHLLLYLPPVCSSSYRKWGLFFVFFKLPFQPSFLFILSFVKHFSHFLTYFFNLCFNKSNRLLPYALYELKCVYYFRSRPQCSPLLGILYTSIQLTKPTVLDQCRSKSICCVNFNLQVECDTVLYSPESFPVTKKCILLQSSLLLPFNLGRWGRGKSCEAQKIWKNI